MHPLKCLLRDDWFQKGRLAVLVSWLPSFQGLRQDQDDGDQGWRL
jgi:hypothetical protein